jgi:hypothetical protein
MIYDIKIIKIEEIENLTLGAPLRPSRPSKILIS